MFDDDSISNPSTTIGNLTIFFVNLDTGDTDDGRKNWEIMPLSMGWDYSNLPLEEECTVIHNNNNSQLYHDNLIHNSLLHIHEQNISQGKLFTYRIQYL